MNILARRPVQIVVGVIVALVLFGGGVAFGSNRAASTATSTTSGATGATGAAVIRGGAGASGSPRPSPTR